MTRPLTILAICGSLRKGSFNAALIRAMQQLAPGDVTIETGPSVGNLPHFDADLEAVSGTPAGALTLGGMIRHADALIVVTPEFNASIPGVLKNALDWLSRVPGTPVVDKPVLVKSVSPGALGGARMQPHLRQILSAMGAYVYPRPDIAVAGAATRFDESGRLIDPPTRELVRKQLADFAVFTRRFIDPDEGA